MASRALNNFSSDNLEARFSNDYAIFGPEKIYLPTSYAKYQTSIKNLKIREDDIIVASYPKTGTTWTQEMIWLLENNFDFKGAELNLSKRFPHLEICCIYSEPKNTNLIKEHPQLYTSVDFVEKIEGKRLIKTHLPFSLLPENIGALKKRPKIIYVFRNPKDVCVSFYNHGKVCHGWGSTLENFADLFLKDKAPYGPFWNHVFGYWNERKNFDILLVKYEEMKEDLVGVIKRVNKFLNGADLAEQRIEDLLGHLSFDAMKNNKAVNHDDLIKLRRTTKITNDGAFMRSGVVGNYKENLSLEDIERFNLWIARNIAGSDFEAQYDYKW